MATRKSKSKPTKRRPEGYRVFMSNFAGYARENGIKIHGGRGSFAKKAGEVWKDLKSKPSWKENLDVILPQYLEGVEGSSGKFTLDNREDMLLQGLSLNEFSWWNLKNMYGVWHESIYVKTDVDRLMFRDSGGGLNDISSGDETFYLGQVLKNSVEDGEIDKYSYFVFDEIAENDNGGLDVIFLLNESDQYRIHLHDKDYFKWDKTTRERYGIKKEIVGEPTKIKGKRIPTFSKAMQEKQTNEFDIQKTQASTQKIRELNVAVEKLESQLKRKLITKSEYKKYLNVIMSK